MTANDATKALNTQETLSESELQDLVATTDTGGRKPGKAVSILIGAVALSWALFQLWVASPLPTTLRIQPLIFNSTHIVSIHLSFAIFLAFLVYPSKTQNRRPGITAYGIAALFAGAGVWVLFGGLSQLTGSVSGGEIVDSLNFEKERYARWGGAIALFLLSLNTIRFAPRRYVPELDWIFAFVSAFCAGYIYLVYDNLASRSGNPNAVDLVVATVGMLFLLEAVRRTLGPPLMIIASLFLFYTFRSLQPNLEFFFLGVLLFGAFVAILGDIEKRRFSKGTIFVLALSGLFLFSIYAFDLSSFFKSYLQWKGASGGKVVDQMWISTSGVFGTPLKVSATIVFLFVLFGALLDKAGAGNYFIKVAFAALGHLKGGPAIAAVISSALTGLISGSSIANVVTTGTFTIPMMKRVGFSPEKSGAVEVASSVNGQLMPPVMGAAAFLIATSLNMEYFDVVKHAALPAIISYIALVYIVYLEACKNNLQGLKPLGKPKAWYVLSLLFVFGVILLVAFFKVLAFALGGVRFLLGENAIYFVLAALLFSYIGAAYISSRQPDLKIDDPNSPILSLPPFKSTALSGLHFLLPVVLLVWLLMIERKSAGLSAFWATVFMSFILLTQKSLFSFFRKQSFEGAFKQGFFDLGDSFIAGSRNMIGIALATAAAGIIVGVVDVTGVGGVFAALVEKFSFGRIELMLLWTAVLSLILGMGLPTTANYIVVSSLLAPVILTLAPQNGLIVLPIAVHLFVFYYGIMADVTPPVGLASFAAAAISGGDPLKTGFVAFFYSLRTAVLPFLFIFNSQLLLVDVTFLQGVLIFIVATVAMLLFTAATQGYFLTKSKLWEGAALLLVAFTLFNPKVWMDKVKNPYEYKDPSEVYQVFEKSKVGDTVRVHIEGQNDVGETFTTYREIKVPEGQTGQERVSNFGLDLLIKGEDTIVDNVAFGSSAEKEKYDFDQKILEIGQYVGQPTPYLFFIPAFLLLGLVVMAQRRRRARFDSDSTHPATA